MIAFIRRAFYTLLFLFAVFACWMLVFVHPNPARVPDPLSVLDGADTSPRQRLHAARNLLFDLGDAHIDAPSLDNGRREMERLDFFSDYPFARPGKNGAMAASMTQGKHAMFLEQSNSIYMPTPASVSFHLPIPEGARLRFAASMLSRIDGKQLAPVTIEVTVTGGGRTAKLLSQTLTPEPEFPWSEEDFWYHTFLKFIRIDHGFWNGRWYDHDIDLSAHAGAGSEITFTARTEGGALSHAFIGAPRILAPDDGARPNVIVAIMDTLRADYVGANNEGAKGLTPNIDAMAAEGVNFTNVRSQGNWSRGSFASIFTGVPVPSLGFSERWSYTREEKRIYNERRLPSLADQFRKAGYTTVSIGNNPFVYDGSPVGLHLGFDRAIDIQREPYDTEFSTAEAIRWLKDHRDERFFMMFTLNSAHSPFRPPFKYLKQGFGISREIIKNPQKLLFRGVAAYADDYFGKFLEALDRLGLSQNTLIAVTADHGVILSRGGAIRAKPGGRYDWIGATHTHTLYEEETRVPLAVRYPGKTAKGEKSAAPLALMDLAPTLAQAAGIEPDPRWPGISFMDELENPDGRADGDDGRAITAEGESVWSMVTPDNYKYIRRGVAMARTLDESTGAPRSIKEEVFDLRADPSETRDLSRERPELAEDLRKRFALEYPSHVSVYKILARGVDNFKNLTFDINTQGRFVFLDVSKAEGNDGLDIKVENDGPSRRVVRLAGIKSFVRIFFEVSPRDAPVSVEVMDGEGKQIDPRAIRLTALRVKSGRNPVSLPAGRESFYLSDPGRLVDELADGDGVYIVTIPFSLWRSDAAEGARLDPELESMMRKWGYL